MIEDEMLIRTFFRQIAGGLEYLHLKKIAHLNLKLENLVIGKDYELKIEGMTYSFHDGDNQIIGKGTKNFRAPELRAGKYHNPMNADIFSLGIILFVLKEGRLPYKEGVITNELDLEKILLDYPDFFWNAY